MHSIIVLMILLINIYLLVAMPSAFFYNDEDYDEDIVIRQLSKRFLSSPWVNKRNPALCDYRLQLRPLPYTSALCAYGQNKDDEGHQINPFKYG